MKLGILISIMVLFSCTIFAQNNKVVFIKKVPIKLKSDSSYSFFVGYDVEKDCDIAIDFSGGPNKFWAGKTVQISKGKGVAEIKVDSNNKPVSGKGYKLVASVRDRGGDWKTTKTASLISNIEITNKTISVLDDASFSVSTPFSTPSKDTYTFDIDYKASQQRNIVVAIYNQGRWMGASKSISVEKGSGTKQIQIKMSPPVEGNKYRFILYYGSGEGFPDKNIVSKEISGIQITKLQKTITIADLREKSILLSLNKSSDILTLPGLSNYEFIQIIAPTGQVIKENKNTNTIQVSDLPQGGYFAITNNNDYYQFIKF